MCLYWEPLCGGSIGAEMMSHGEERPYFILQMQAPRYFSHNSVCFALMSPRSVLLETVNVADLSQAPSLVTRPRGCAGAVCLPVPSASRTSPAESLHCNFQSGSAVSFEIKFKRRKQLSVCVGVCGGSPLLARCSRGIRLPGIRLRIPLTWIVSLFRNAKLPLPVCRLGRFLAGTGAALQRGGGADMVWGKM